MLPSKNQQRLMLEEHVKMALFYELEQTKQGSSSAMIEPIENFNGQNSTLWTFKKSKR